MPTVNACPIGVKPQFELSDGTPAVGNKLFFYVAGSVNTKQNTYTDSTGGSANTNPLVLNSLGMPTTQIWFTAAQGYKIVYAPSNDTDPPSSPIWTIDNLYGINDVSVSQSEWVSGPAPTYVSGTSFTLVGDQTSTFQVGRRLKTTNSGGTIYSTITASAFAAVTTVTVRNDSGTLDAGLSAVSYGLLSATNPAIPTFRGTFTPTLLSGGNQTGRTYTTQFGKYTKDQDGVVSFWAVITLSAVGSSTGDTTFAALPFTSANVGAGMFYAVTVIADDLAAGVTTAVAGYVNNNAAIGAIASYAAGQLTTLQETGLTATSTFIISGSYPTT